MRSTATEYVRRIRENGDKYHNHLIEFDEFHATQVALWDAIHTRGNQFHERVLDLLRTTVPA